MRNAVFNEATKLSLPVPNNTVSGAPVKVGSLIGVTATAEGEGGNAEGYASVWRQGAYDLSVTGAIASVGLPVYITSSNTLTATAGSDTLFGYALETKGAAAGVIRVALAQV
jgi:predicted RecA/RadA family phage recombinase